MSSAPPADPVRTGRPRPTAASLAVWLAVAAFVVVTLGPSVLGLRTFAGIDLLSLSPPYADALPLDAPVQSIFVRDNVDSLLPAYSEFHRRLWDGDLADWAPGRSGGTPLAALPSFGLFSPLSLPYWLLPTWLAVGFVQLLTVGTAIGGMAAFLGRLRCGRAAGLLGGLAFAASGYMIAWVNWPQTRVGAFIPVLFWALERSLQLRTVRSVVPVALAVAGLLLGGFPAVAGLCMYAAAGYVVVRLLAERGVHRWWPTVRQGVLVGVGVALGVAVTAIQLLPFVYYLGDVDLAYRDQQFFATTPLKYATTAVFPQAWFVNATGPGSPFSRDLNPVEINTYAGSVALLLVAVAVLRRPPVLRPRGARWFLLATCLIALWLIFVQGPLTDWMAVLPVFDGNPIGRLRSVLGFAAAALVGLGFDAVLRSRESIPTGQGVGRVRLEQAALVLGVAGLLAGGYVVARSQAPVVGDQVRTEVLVAGAAAVLALLLLLTAPRWGPAGRAAPVIIPLLVAGQAVLAVQAFWPTGDPDDFYPVTITHEYLAEHTEGYRVAPVADVLLPSSTDAYGLDSIGGHSFLAPTWSELLRDIDPRTLATPTIAALDPGRPEYAQAPGLDRLAARYYVSADFFAVPGRERRVNEANGTLRLASGATVQTTIEAQPLRGIGIPVAASGVAFDAGSRFGVTITDAAGEVVAAGERTVLRPRATPPMLRLPATLYLPLAAEDLGDRPGPWTVSVRFTGPDVELAAGDGAPELVLVGPADDGLRLVQVADGVAIYQRLTALPRIRWAADTEVIPDAVERAAYVAGTSYPADTVVLDEPGAAADGRPATVRVDEDSGDVIRVAVQAEGAGYLVVADAIQTGWSVEVDGRPGTLVHADHAFVAVAVAAGRHDIVVRYDPPGQTVGGWVSGAGVLALVLLTLPALRRRRRTAETA